MRRPSQASVCNTAKEVNGKTSVHSFLFTCIVAAYSIESSPCIPAADMQPVVASAEPIPVRIATMSFIQKLMFAFLSSSMVHLLSAYSPPALLPPVPPVPPALAGSARDMLPCPLLSA